MRRVHALAGLLLVAMVTTSAGMKSYLGHHVLSAQAMSEEQLQVLQNLEHQFDVLFLREPTPRLSTDIVVSPEDLNQVMTIMREAGMAASILCSDLQSHIDRERAEIAFSRRKRIMGSSMDYSVYRTIDEVNAVMKGWENSYPQLVKMKALEHKTHESRTVYYLEIGTALDSNGNSNKPVIFVESLTHAREWITTASLIYVIDTLLKNFHNTKFESALTDFTWVVIPVVNPDGYDFTWTQNRFWRKNLRFYSSQRHCLGVDVNRNYDIKFGTVGVSPNCTSDIHHGLSPFSEPETQNVRDLFLQFKARIVSFLSVHAFSQLLLHPWSYTTPNTSTEVPDNLQQLKIMGNKMIQALAYNGKLYRMGTAYDLVGYAASGGSIDWALAEKPGIYSYCFELRPQSFWQGGFMIPATEIIPTGQELLNSLMTMIQNL
uniref:Carboxypeptidase n=1 Tax=Rapana venosa TaxID=55521 RepID=A0A7L8Y800_RAPVE|nr:carboxypeptidase [Rapana venosa]